MSRSSRTGPFPEPQLSEPPNTDTEPVEPPPSPPGGDGIPVVPSNNRSVGSWDELTSTGVVRGWARDPDLPDGPIKVNFYIDAPMSVGSYKGSTWANLLGTPGTPGENHTFAWRIPDSFRNGASHTLYVYAIDCSGLKRDSPLLGQQSFVLMPGNELPLGALEKIDSSGLVSGWTVDPNLATQELTVSFYVTDPSVPTKDGVLAGQVLAHLSRPDVNEATGCSGGHGFEWSIPAQFCDGTTRYLRAYVTDTSTQSTVLLSGSPKSFNLWPTM
jgi:hypothetical protein